MYENVRGITNKFAVDTKIVIKNHNGILTSWAKRPRIKDLVNVCVYFFLRKLIVGIISFSVHDNDTILSITQANTTSSSTVLIGKGMSTLSNKTEVIESKGIYAGMHNRYPL